MVLCRYSTKVLLTLRVLLCSAVMTAIVEILNAHQQKLKSGREGTNYPEPRAPNTVN